MSDTGASGIFPQFTPGVPRSQSYQDIYANQVRLNISMSDINIIFGVLNDRGPGIVVLEDRASVRMAPTTAKILTQHLEALIRTFESVIGEIPMPDSTVTQIESQMQNLAENLATQMGRPTQPESS